MKKIFTILLICFTIIGTSTNLFSQCNPPTNVSATTPHTPNWYSVNLSWDIPASGKSSVVFSNGPVITHSGQGYQGADASAKLNGATVDGFICNKEINYSIADDFTLTGTTQIDSIQFYTIQELEPTPSPGANVKEIYIQIYNGAPNAGGQLVWGDMVTDRKKQVVFPNLYRVPANNLTNNSVPVMKTTALIGTSLPAGTYWLEVSVTSIIPTNYGARILFPPVTISGQASTGNALQKVSGTWQNMIDSGNNGHGALPMEIYGEASSIMYNVYRNNVKLTNTPIEILSYSDIAPGAGTYTYGVTTVCPSGESPQATKSVVLATYPCELVTVITDNYSEGFENGIPMCWEQEPDNQNKYWEAVIGSQSNPSTAHTGSRKLMFRHSGNAKTKIITEELDITGISNPELSFWHAQRASGSNQDQLYVYYKNSASASWTQIGAFTNNIAEWSWTTISLPNPSASYWIAFEAIGKNGSGVMIDDIMIKTEGGSSCNMPQDLSYEMNSPEWFNVNLSWDYPAGAMPGDASEISNNGPIITHTGQGYGGANVSAAENAADIGANVDQLAGFSIADDFTLDKPTLIENMSFYLYEKFTENNDPTYIDMLFVRIFDDSPKNGGKVIWGNTYDNLINRSLTKFSGIYRTDSDNLQDNSRPIMKVFADINHTLPAGTYWVAITAVSLVPPSSNGCVYAVPVTVVGQSFNGNAEQSYIGQWSNWVGSTGQCALPFEVNGKQLPLTYSVFRDDELLDENIAQNNYLDFVPAAGSYEYCVKAVWDYGCVSDAACVNVNMPTDPCAAGITSFTYLESFENYSDNQPLETGCWRQEYVVMNQDSGIDWEIIDADFSEPNNTPHGNHKLIFYTGEGYSTKLISPRLVLSNLTDPMLHFWHAQKEWLGSQNILRLYYKNSVGGSWNLLEEWNNDIPNWVQESIALPNPTANYWIAFEGEAYYGRPIMIDKIVIDGTIGFKEQKLEKVQIYPNPAQNTVNISGENITKVMIYNAMGQLVAESDNTSTIDVSSLNAGIYIFKVFDDTDNFVTRKIVVTK